MVLVRSVGEAAPLAELPDFFSHFSLDIYGCYYSAVRALCCSAWHLAVAVELKL